MTNTLNSLKEYVNDTLGITLAIHSWKSESKLPLMIRETYRLYESDLLKNRLLLMLADFEEEKTPAVIKKHMGMVSEEWNGEVVLVFKEITSYNRKRLIEHKVPFIVPGNQMYLPILGIDLREYFRKIKKNTVKISPSTQVVILYSLYKNKYGPLIPSSIAKELKYSTMTMTRVFDEIEHAELGEIKIEGRERVLKFNANGKELWERTRNLMNSPVKKRVYVINENQMLCKFPVAGLTGLSRYSMLAEPIMKTYALSIEEWKTLNLKEIPAADENSAMLEIWRYSPSHFSKDGIVDKLSLYLSLSDDKDDRVEKELKEMMEKTIW